MLKQLKKMLFSRMGLVGVLIAFQIAIILVMVIEFSRYYLIYSVAVFVLAVLFFIKIMNADQSTAYKLSWSILILTFPAFGVAIYLIFGGRRLAKQVAKQTQWIYKVTEDSLGKNEDVLSSLESEDRYAAKQARYVFNTSACPVYANNSIRYFPTGEDFFDVFLDELRGAKKYIFLEYFIIGKGVMWDRVHSILLEKLAEGVDVRVIYDDIGSILVSDLKFGDRLRAEGIKCHVFHRFVPILTGVQNNRDHRKICVIDGVTAFTGGLNIADEYINEIDRFGYWKDNAVMIKGGAAWSFAVMFLTMWDELEKTAVSERGDYSAYKPSEIACDGVVGSGYIQPYKDTPLDYEATGENVYLSIIASAKDRVWITTPYLIIDERMEQALCTAAKSGVDVRIVTPRIPDKMIVKKATESFYPKLIMNGVKIYEYTPGFIHSKMFLCDDKTATVGSINLDYRSFYLHFECGLWMYDADCIGDIESDFLHIFGESEQIETWKTGAFRQVMNGILSIVSPLL